MSRRGRLDSGASISGNSPIRARIGLPGKNCPTVQLSSLRTAACSVTDAVQGTLETQEGLGSLYFTPEGLAAALVVSVKTIFRWADSDPSMPVLRIGNPGKDTRGRRKKAVVRFPKDRVLRWFREREQGVSPGRQSRKQVLGTLQVRSVPSLPRPANPACAEPCADSEASA